MKPRRMVARGLVLLLAVLMTVAAMGSVAAAAKSPAGIVTDESNTLTADQLAFLDKSLTGLKYQYRVILLAEAFPGDKPADAAPLFETLADGYLAQRQVPKDAVLITIALKERLFDVRAWKDGPVNADFLQKQGSEFRTFSLAIGAAFRTPAQAGDIPGGIVAAAKYVEELTAAAPTPAPSVTPSAPAPSQPSTTPAPSATPTPGPVTEPAQPQVPPQPVDVRPLWYALFGAGLLVLLVSFAVKLARYRRKMRDVVALRDSFLGDLLHLMEKELPMARTYQGEKTRAAATLAIAKADEALQLQQAAEELRVQAEQKARKLLFGRAFKLAEQAGERYTATAAAFGAAKTAWEPMGFALRNYDQVSQEGAQRKARAADGLSGEKARTGFGLEHMAGRIQQASDALDQGRDLRQNDPVAGMECLQAAVQTLDGVLAHLGQLPEAQKLMEQWKQSHARFVQAVSEARGRGLRFLELSPEEALAGARTAEETMAGSLPRGDLDRFQEGLQGLDRSLQEIARILERYDTAIRQCPVKAGTLRQQLPLLGAERQGALDVLQVLHTRFDAEDWSDVAGVAEQLAALQTELQQGLPEVDRLTTLEVQLYLKAEAMLDGWLARLDEARKAESALSARPAELEALVQESRRNLDVMHDNLQQLEALAARDALRLPVDLVREIEGAHESGRALQAALAGAPVGARRLARETAAGSDLSRHLYQGVQDIARRAAQARAELERVRRQSMTAFGYARYDRHNHEGILRGAMAAAEAALAAGQYDLALAESNRAMDSCRGLEEAYQAHLRAVEEAERRQREAAEAARRASESHHNDNSFGSGGSSSFGSSSSSHSSSSNSSNGSGGTSGW